MTDAPDNSSPPEPSPDIASERTERHRNVRIVSANWRCVACDRAGELYDYVSEGDESLHVDCPACHSRIIAIAWGAG
jgi:DNA-directed RNA polymerase subunit RPC12/RpoP